MRHFLFLLLLSAGVSGAACMAEEPETGTGDGTPGGADAGVDEDVIEEGVKFNFAGLPPQTYWDTVPVHGQGPVNGSVIVESSNGAVAVELGGDGSFCLDVPLAKGALNTMTLVAIDQDGERSEVQTAEVLQQGEPPEPGQATPPANIALGGLPIESSTVTVSEGSWGALTDGNLSTGVRVSNAAFSSDWMIMQVPIADGVEKIRVYSDADCPMEEYLLHTAQQVTGDMLAPGTEELDVGSWTYRGHFGSDAGDADGTDCSTSSYSCQEYAFDSNVVGAIGIRFMSADCAAWYESGKHQMQEVQAWTPQGVAPPSVVAPSCQGGI